MSPSMEQCLFAVACIAVAYGVAFWRGLKQGYEEGFRAGSDWGPKR